MLIANPPYMGIKTFLQVPYSPDLSKSPKVAILGIPYDLNVTNRPGARFAPEAIRKASTLLCEGFEGEEVLDFGDILNGLKNTPQETFEEITNYLTRVLEKKIIPVSIGEIIPSHFRFFERWQSTINNQSLWCILMPIPIHGKKIGA